MPGCNGADRGCGFSQHHPTRKRADFQAWSFITREFGKPFKEGKQMIHVGEKVPDFVAPGYQQGKFINVKLSDYLGKWVLLCFYPGDFTFV